MKKLVLKSDPLHKGKRIDVARKKKFLSAIMSGLVTTFWYMYVKGLVKCIDSETGETYDLRPEMFFNECRTTAIE